MITKEQIEEGCDIWVIGNKQVQFSVFNKFGSKPFIFEDVVDFVCGNEAFHTTKLEAELHLLEDMLNN